jgi:2-amino-4-hydroxy-6-hydroxymethyldihydropteridine diphosphokinase
MFMDGCWIGIGGNLGDAQLAFRSVWDHLRSEPKVVLKSRSGLYQTQPVGQHAGGSFTNAVFSLSTSLIPIELLELLQSIESELGRQRGVRWGARPIDLDILYIDQVVISEPRLIVPHPGAWYRRFVIDPLAEVAPDLRHPQLHQTVAELSKRLLSRPLVVACPEWTTSDLQTEFGDIQSQFPQAQLIGSDSESPAAVAVQLGSGPRAATRDGTPIADLTSTPGDRSQRLGDFLTAALDQPVRVGDWVVDC